MSTPASSGVDSLLRPQAKKISVHHALGGGVVSDVLLWRKPRLSATILGSVTVFWVFFELSGYTLLTLLANAAMVLLAVLFGWSQFANTFNRSPPSIPIADVDEDVVKNIAESAACELNKALTIARELALGRDYLLVGKVLVGLYILSWVGSWFNSLTLLFISVVAAFTFPVFYEKYDRIIDSYFEVVVLEVRKLYFAAQKKLSELLNKVGGDKKQQ